MANDLRMMLLLLLLPIPPRVHFGEHWTIAEGIFREAAAAARSLAHSTLYGSARVDWLVLFYDDALDAAAKFFAGC